MSVTLFGSPFERNFMILRRLTLDKVLKTIDQRFILTIIIAFLKSIRQFARIIPLFHKMINGVMWAECNSPIRANCSITRLIIWGSANLW